MITHNGTTRKGRGWNGTWMVTLITLQPHSLSFDDDRKELSKSQGSLIVELISVKGNSCVTIFQPILTFDWHPPYSRLQCERGCFQSEHSEHPHQPRQTTTWNWIKHFLSVVQSIVYTLYAAANNLVQLYRRWWVWWWFWCSWWWWRCLLEE